MVQFQTDWSSITCVIRLTAPVVAVRVASIAVVLIIFISNLFRVGTTLVDAFRRTCVDQGAWSLLRNDQCHASGFDPPACAHEGCTQPNSRECSCIHRS